MLMILYLAVARIGYVPPFSILSGILTAVGGGLHALLQPDSSVGKWIGFQILAGAGRGAGLQMVRCTPLALTVFDIHHLPNRDL